MAARSSSTVRFPSRGSVTSWSAGASSPSDITPRAHAGAAGELLLHQAPRSRPILGVVDAHEGVAGRDVEPQRVHSSNQLGQVVLLDAGEIKPDVDLVQLDALHFRVGARRGDDAGAFRTFGVIRMCKRQPALREEENLGAFGQLRRVYLRRRALVLAGPSGGFCRATRRRRRGSPSWRRACAHRRHRAWRAPRR